jgi:uncharacterized protein YbjT (DUF2867 family)
MHSDGRARVLVAGATGRQGGAVIDHLLAGEAGPVAVRALTRTPGSDAARRLAARGVEVVEGDLTDRAAMDAACEGVDGLYLVTAGSADDEWRQGRTAIDAAAAAGVGTVVYSSGGGADTRPGIPHVDAKADVETRLRDSGVAWTALAPHSFTTNLGRVREAVAGGELPFPMAPGERLALVDPDDVGRLAALALRRVTERGAGGPDAAPGRDPDVDRFVGARIEVAGGTYSLPGMAAACEAVVGHPVEPVSTHEAAPPDRRRVVTWMAGLDAADVPERLREVYGFEPRGLVDALRRAGWGDGGDSPAAGGREGR